MKNYAKVGMSLFVVIALLFLACGEVEAKGAIRVTIILHGGPPNTTYTAHYSFRDLLLSDGPNVGRPGGRSLEVNFDSQGNAEVHFLITYFCSRDVYSGYLVITLHEVETHQRAFEGEAELVDRNGDGVIGAQDTQQMEATLIDIHI